MKLNVSSAIVLHHTNYGEADRIVTLLTPDYGRIKGFARHARKSRRRFGASLETFAEVRLHWKLRPGSDLASIQEAELVTLRAGLRNNLETLALAGYGCELSGALFDEAVGAAEIFLLLKAFLDHLNLAGASPEARLLLELRLLSVAGYVPHLQHCAECNAGLPAGTVGFSADRNGSLCDACGGSKARLCIDRMTLGTLGRILQTPLESFTGFRLSPLSRREGLLITGDALRCHLPGVIKSQAFLDELKTFDEP
ncbi:MAG TPA: DNA repair protein RecO [Desulfuromonadales bacterium]|nr:DNA repair protein RecO [Desulfuromonadales bacterium]